jgi:hypothetical protein
MSVIIALKGTVQFSLHANRLAQKKSAYHANIASRISVRIVPLVPYMLG